MDGTCSVAINIEHLFTVGHASYTQIKEAAQAVFNVCAASLVSTGGLAHIIGESGTRILDFVDSTSARDDASKFDGLLLIAKNGCAGSDNHLYITLSKTSYPNVECAQTSRPPNWLPCQIITESIETTNDIRSFGPGAQVNLPWISRSCKLEEVLPLSLPLYLYLHLHLLPNLMKDFRADRWTSSWL